MKNKHQKKNRNNYLVSILLKRTRKLIIIFISSAALCACWQKLPSDILLYAHMKYTPRN